MLKIAHMGSHQSNINKMADLTVKIAKKTTLDNSNYQSSNDEEIDAKDDMREKEKFYNMFLQVIHQMF